MSVIYGYIGRLFVFLAFLAVLYKAMQEAYNIRLYAIKEYGLVIHEFDPWFNYRATEYLAQHGVYEFFHWYDYMSWYPLGRPVGSTIYPGMQLSSVGIWKALNWYGHEISLNDVCCMVPAWFGVSATVFLALLAGETSGSWSVAGAAATCMAIVPAHIMRSVGGGYDNESVAMTALCATFYFWIRALRDDPSKKDGAPTRDSYVFGTMCGFAYIYMVAAWGGFVFVLNMIGLHAAVLTALGRYSSKLHRAYSLFFFIGTLGAIQIPVVGWGPLKSLEQLGPCLVFVIFQLLEYCEHQRRKKNLTIFQVFSLRVKVFTPAALVAALVVAQLLNMGYFGPMSARVRGLFVAHTRTGNPLVDSVAEHQPASEQAYTQYLHQVVYDLCPIGLGLCVLRWTDANSFFVLYAGVAYYFSSKMSRLILLLGPVASVLTGVVIGFCIDRFGLFPLKHLLSKVFDIAPASAEEAPKTDKDPKEGGSKNTKKDGKSKKNADKVQSGCKEQFAAFDWSWQTLPFLGPKLVLLVKLCVKIAAHPAVCLVRLAIGAFLFMGSPGVFDYEPLSKYDEFYKYSQGMAERMSHPSIMFKAQLRSGETVIVDDYREAYWYLRDKTPEDARVLSWWDYGYQITGIGNRTTLADGNTWNHEHIATLGRILTASEKESHRIARHLADYVLVWSGGGGDDLAKSPHMARIGNSVFPDMCPNDPTCSKFGFYQGGVPTPMMEKSLLYKLTQYGYKKGVTLDPNRYQHVFSSKYGKCRVFKINNVSEKSKKWVADASNRVCDAPGSWYCGGQYPPALKKLIESRKNFAQLENFNTKRSEEDDEYNKEYMEKMAGKKNKKEAPKPQAKKKKKDTFFKAEYVGCFGHEAMFGEDRSYVGEGAGANIKQAFVHALKKKMDHVAIARVESTGHAFAFNKLDLKGGKKFPDADCRYACLDEEEYGCGCADNLCAGMSHADGEEHLRRWAVYKVPEETKKLWAEKKKKRAKKKAKKKKKN